MQCKIMIQFFRGIKVVMHNSFSWCWKSWFHFSSFIACVSIMIIKICEKESPTQDTVWWWSISYWLSKSNVTLDRFADWIKGNDMERVSSISLQARNCPCWQKRSINAKTVQKKITLNKNKWRYLLLLVGTLSESY